MSTSIDERIVQMRFDNQQFESGVQKSLGTLDKLKAALKLDDASRSLDAVSKAANGFNLNGVTTAVGQATQGFSALEVMATGALLRIGSQAADAGTKLIKSLSTDNIMAGWDKFEKKTTSVATLVAQGFSQEEVNEQMERLNWFTDETSYNFTDMVDNIGKFTASGQSLEDSVTAMEGIANWAALSGQNARKASMAMYQLSQAMSKGVLKYDDWKSVQNAGMDNKEFRKQAVQTAIDLGRVTKAGEDLYEVVGGKGQFSLAQLFTSDAMSRQPWLDTDVMMTTFQKYSAAVDDVYKYIEEQEAKGRYITASTALEELGGKVDGFGLEAFKAAQQARTWTDVVDSVKDAVSTGWMNSFELIIGDATEATKVFTDLANTLWDVFASGGEERNAWLKEWRRLGGRDELLAGFKNLYGGLSNAMSPVRTALRDTLGFGEDLETSAPLVGRILTDFSKNFNKFTKSFSDFTAGNSDDIQAAFRGLFSVVQLGAKAFGFLLKAVTPVIKPISALVTVVIKGAGAIGRFLTSITGLIANSTTLKDIFGGISSAIDTFATFLASGISKVSMFIDIIRIFLGPVGAGFIAAWYNLKKALDGFLAPLKELLRSGIGSLVEKIWGTIKSFDIGGALTKVQEALAGILSLKPVKIILDGIVIALAAVATVAGGAGLAIYSLLSTVFSVLTSGGLQTIGTMIIDTVVGIGTKIKDKFVEIFTGDTIIAEIVRKIGSNSAVQLAFGAIVGVITTITSKVSEAAKKIDRFAKMFHRAFLVNGIEGVLKVAENLFKMFFTRISKRINEFVSKNPFIQGMQTFVNDVIVKNVLGAFDKLNAGTDKALDKINTFAAKFRLAFRANGFAGVFNVVKSDFTSFIQGIGDSILGFISNHNPITAFQDFVKSLTDSVKNFFMEKTFIGPLTTFMKGFTDKAKELLVKDGFFDSLKELGENAKKAVEPLKELGKAILGFIKTLKPSDIAMLAGAAGITKMAFSVGGLIDSFTDLNSAMKDITLAKFGLLKPNKGILQTLSESLLKASIAIVILIGALKLLEKVDLEKIKGNLIVLGGLLVSLSISAAIFGKFAPELARNSIVLVAFSAGTYILAKALVQISSLKPEQLKGKVLALIELMGALALLSIACGRISLLSGVGLVVLAYGLQKALPIIEDICKTNFPNLKKRLEQYSGLIKTIGMIALAITALQAIGGGNLSKGIVRIAIGALALVGVVKLLAKSSQKDVEKGIAFIKATLGMFAILALIGKIPGGSNFKGLGAMLLLSSVSLLILVSIAKTLSKLDEKTIDKGVKALAKFVGLIAILEIAAGQIAKVKFRQFLGAILLVGAIAGSLYGLSKFTNWKAVVGSAAGIGIVMLALAKSMRIMQTTVSLEDTGVRFGTWLAAISALGAVAAALYGMSKTNANWKTILASAAGLYITLAAVSKAMGALQSISDEKDHGVRIGTVIKSIIALAGVATVLGLFVRNIGSVKITVLIASASAMWIALDALTRCMQAIQDMSIEEGKGVKWKTVGAALAGLAGVAGALWLLSGPFGSTSWSSLLAGAAALRIAVPAFGQCLAIIGSVGGLQMNIDLKAFAAAIFALFGVAVSLNIILASGADWTQMIAASVSMVILLNGLAVCLNVCSALGTVVGPAAAGAGLLLAFIGIIGIILGAIGALDTEGKAAEFVGKGGEVLSAIGKAIGEFIGSIIGGFGSGIASGFADIGTQLSLFAQNASAFFELIGGENVKNAADSILSLVESLFKIAAANMIETIVSKITGSSSLDSFGDNLITLGKGLAGFSTEVSGKIDEGAVTAAASAASILVELERGLVKHGGAIQAIVGDNDLGKFGEGIKVFGSAIAEYSSAVSGEGTINQDAIAASAAAADILVELERGLVKHGGVIQGIFGDNDLETFGNGIKEFGKAIAVYSAIVSKDGAIDEEAIKASKRAGDLLVELESSIPKVSVIGVLFTGVSSWATLTTGLTNFGTTLVNFSRIVSGENAIDQTAIETAKNCGDLLNELLIAVPKTQGIMGFFTGGNSSWYTLSSGLVAFGIAMSGFSKEITKDGGLDSEAIESAAKCGELLAALQIDIPEDAPFWGLFGGGHKWDTLGDGLADFAKSLVSFSGVVSENPIDSAAIATATNGIKSVVSLLKVADESGLTDQNGLAKVGNFFGGLVGHGDAFEENQGQGLGKTLLSVAKAVSDYSNALGTVDFAKVTSASTNLKNLVDIINGTSALNTSNISALGPALEELATTNVQGFLSAFETTDPGPSITTFITAVTTAITGHNTDFKQPGTDCASQFVAGLTDMLLGEGGVAKAASDAVQGFINGIDLDALRAAGASMGSTVLAGVSESTGWNSPWTTMIQAGKDAVGGLTEGINSGDAQGSGAEFGLTFLEGFRDVTGWHSWWDTMINAGKDAGGGLGGGWMAAMPQLSALVKNSVLGQIITPVVDGIKGGANSVAEYLKHATNGAIDLTNTSGTTITDMIDNFITDATGATEEGANATTNAAENAANAATDSAEKVKKAVKATTSDVKKTVELMSFAGPTVKAFYKRFGEAFKFIGDDAPLEASKRAVALLAEQIWQSTKKTETATGQMSKSTKSHMEEVKEAFMEMHSKLSDTIAGQIDIFNKFEKEDSMSAKELLENMRSQIKGVTEWQNDINALAAKGVGRPLLEKLGEMGPQGSKYLEAFLQMSQDELKEAEELYATSLTFPDSAATSIMASYAYAGATSSESFMTGLMQYQDQINAATETIVEGSSAAGVSKAEETAPEIGEATDKGDAKGIKENQEIVNNATAEMITKSVDANKDHADSEGKRLASYTTSAYSNTVREGTSDAYDATYDFTEAGYEGGMDGQKSRSPSKLWMDIAGYAIAGFVNTFSENASAAYNAGYETTSTAVDGASQALLAMKDVGLDDDLSPVITPVVDLTNVQNGVNQMNGMFNRAPSLNTSLSSMQLAGLASVQSKLLQNQTADRELIDAINRLSSKVDDEGGVNINVSVYGTEGQDVNELADIVADKLSATIQRRKAVWA